MTTAQLADLVTSRLASADAVIVWLDEYDGDDELLHAAEAAARAEGSYLCADESGDLVIDADAMALAAERAALDA